MIALVAAKLVSLALFLVPIAVTGPEFPALALVNSVAAYLIFLASFLVAVVVTDSMHQCIPCIGCRQLVT